MTPFEQATKGLQGRAVQKNDKDRKIYGRLFLRVARYV